MIARPHSTAPKSAVRLVSIAAALLGSAACARVPLRPGYTPSTAQPASELARAVATSPLPAGSVGPAVFGPPQPYGPLLPVETPAPLAEPSPEPSPTQPADQPAPEVAQDAAADGAPDPAPDDAAQPPPDPEPPPRPAPPQRLLIPRIGVNAPVIPVGELPDGAMDAPKTPTQVGWWEPGYRPGEPGSAVMGGHVDFAGYGAAVFWNLKLLKPGDQIMVTSDDGQLTFTVTEVDVYRYDDTSMIARTFTEAGTPELNLISCTGTFDPRTHNYDKRIVVYSSAQ